jgi:hypothetical protein
MHGWKFTGTSMAKMLDPSKPETTGSVGPNWNPLTDDGDALRLAVKVRRMPELIRDGSGVFCGYESKRNYHSPIIERFSDDQMAAIRRAIVRAAADIGRSLP